MFKFLSLVFVAATISMVRCAPTENSTDHTATYLAGIDICEINGTVSPYIAYRNGLVEALRMETSVDDFEFLTDYAVYSGLGLYAVYFIAGAENSSLNGVYYAEYDTQANIDEFGFNFEYTDLALGTQSSVIRFWGDDFINGTDITMRAHHNFHFDDTTTIAHTFETMNGYGHIPNPRNMTPEEVATKVANLTSTIGFDKEVWVSTSTVDHADRFIMITEATLANIARLSGELGVESLISALFTSILVMDNAVLQNDPLMEPSDLYRTMLSDTLTGYYMHHTEGRNVTDPASQLILEMHGYHSGRCDRVTPMQRATSIAYGNELALTEGKLTATEIRALFDAKYSDLFTEPVPEESEETVTEEPEESVQEESEEPEP